MLGSGRRYSWGRGGDDYFVWDKRAPGESLGHATEATARREFHWLEQEEKIRRRRRRTRFLLVAGLIGVAAAPAIVTFANRSPDHAPADVAGTSLPDRFANEEGGYGFRVPAGWRVVTSGSSSQVTSPDGGVAISVLVAPDGDLADVSDASVANISSDWTGMQAESPQARAVGDLSGISVSGTAVDASGAPIRFLSIVIDSGTRNHAIWVSVPETSDPATFLDSIEGILSTFKPLETA